MLGIYESISALATKINRLCCAVKQLQDGGGGSYKVYTAILTQTGTDAPEQNVLENTLGTGLIYTYDSTGEYYAQLESGNFDPAKTFINITNSHYSQPFSIYSGVYDLDNSYLIITTYDENGYPVELNGNASIEIRVYS
jgi:hypothetical protein